MADDETKVAALSPAGDRVESGQHAQAQLFEELAEILADALVADIESAQRQSVA